ncbi:cobalt-precorrin-5B (C(1))-methyltransferase CbiD [Desulfonauticus submarinus]
MRFGLSTGTYAAALAKAGTLALVKKIFVPKVWILLPEGMWVQIPVKTSKIGKGVLVSTVKDAGDDPDITHGLELQCRLELRKDSKIRFNKGKGLGIITKPGLALPIGEVAINPVPRNMIKKAIRQVFLGGVNLTFIIPKGEEIAAKTFNPRLGIKGGISILGTSGRVRPFSLKAIQETIRLHLNSLLQQEIKTIVLVPGRIGEKAAQKLGFNNIVEVSNEWQTAFDYLQKKNLQQIIVVGHPGKLLKFLQNDFDTHSKRSKSAVPILEKYLFELFELKVKLNTVEQGFKILNNSQKRKCATFLANLLKIKIKTTFCLQSEVCVYLIDYKSNVLNF